MEFKTSSLDMNFIKLSINLELEMVQRQHGTLVEAGAWIHAKSTTRDFYYQSGIANDSWQQ
eukprot:5215376-Amphidinium_carterae.1